MGHHSCCNKQKVKRGLWSPEEDEKLINYISTYGHGCWSSVPKLAGNIITALSLSSLFYLISFCYRVCRSKTLRVPNDFCCISFHTFLLLLPLDLCKFIHAINFFSNFLFSCMDSMNCRPTEMWKELQTKMDKLSQA